ncbi:MAG: cytochrome c [Candidatus Eisenbacteria bacterium]
MRLELVSRGRCVALALALAASFAPLSAAGAPAKGNAAAGKSIFNVKCVSCHKVDGSGGVALGTGKTPNWTLPATWSEPKRKDQDAYLRNAIANGDLPKGMVPFVKSGQLKPAEVENLIAHIHALAKHK